MLISAIAIASCVDMYSYLMFEKDIIELVLNIILCLYADIDGGFVRGYIQSIGKLNFIDGANSMVNDFVNELRSIIDDFKVPLTADFQQFLAKVVSAIEMAAVETITESLNSANATQCIRQVIEVYTHLLEHL